MIRVRHILRECLFLLRDWRLYVGLGALAVGIGLNFLSQAYLYDYVETGHALPPLSDIILDHIPYWDIDIVSDFAGIASFFIFLVYVAHRDKLRFVPFFLLLCGVFNIVRGVFIVLTPFGNPELFDGTDGLFKGFAYKELGVYPSGHTGITFMYFVLAQDWRYRVPLMVCLLLVIASLFLARSHYSVDVLSGVFFAYAIRCYGEKYWGRLKLPPDAMPD